MITEINNSGSLSSTESNPFIEVLSRRGLAARRAMNGRNTSIPSIEEKVAKKKFHETRVDSASRWEANRISNKKSHLSLGEIKSTKISSEIINTTSSISIASLPSNKKLGVGRTLEEMIPDSAPKLEKAHTSDTVLNQFTRRRKKIEILQKLDRTPSILTRDFVSDEKKIQDKTVQKTRATFGPHLKTASASSSDLDESTPQKSVSFTLSRTIKPSRIQPKEASTEFFLNILFSQKSVSDSTFDRKTRIEYSLNALACSIFKNGFDQNGAIDIVKFSETIFTSVDNRRLLIVKKIGRFCPSYKIWVRIHESTDQLTGTEQHRFNAYTWGEAVKKRILAATGKDVDGLKRQPTILIKGGARSGERQQDQKLCFKLSNTEIENLTLRGYDRALMIENTKKGCLNF